MNNPGSPESSPLDPGSCPTLPDGSIEHNGQSTAPDLPRFGAGAIAALLFALGLVFLGLFLLGFLPHRERQARLQSEVAAARDLAPVVVVARPVRDAPTRELRLPGDIRPKQSTSIFARTSGYLKKLHVDIGERVKAGQLLAEIDSPEVVAALAKARAILEQVRADREKAAADLGLAESTLARFEGFSKEGGVTRQQLDERRSSVAQAQAALAAAEAEIGSAQAEVVRLERLEELQRLHAPFDGVVTSRPLDLGALLVADNSDQGKELFRIAMTNPLRIFVEVPQVHIGLIRNQSEAQVEVRNFPGRTFRGRVMRSTGEVDSATRTLKFLVLVENDDGALYPGMYSQVRFQLLESEPPWTIPSSALLINAAGTSVAVLEEGLVHFRKVVVGNDLGARVQILEGISGDDLVIQSPGERLKDGGPARVRREDTP